jgi:molecular chaperone DnaJ
MSSKRNYYDVLRVKKDASAEEIKAAFRKLSKIYHADNKPDDPEAEAKHKELNDAYTVLKNDEKRAEYDNINFSTSRKKNTGQRSRAASGGPSGNANDFFNSFFGAGFGNYARSQRGGSEFGDFNRNNGKKKEPERGRDVSINIRIKQEEALTGGKKGVAFNFKTVCGTCAGEGLKDGPETEKCKVCNGSGSERVITKSPLGDMAENRVCSACQGKGRRKGTYCEDCAGSGYVDIETTIYVKITKGIKTGHVIPVNGMGDLSEPGGARGDLLVKVTVES